MSEIKVNSIKGVGASTAAITVNNTDGTCTANLSNRQNRNLIINGAMQVAQRDTSSTSQGFQTVDRFAVWFSGTDEAPTQAQVDVASGTTPYTSGFRKAIKVTNGNQTSGAGASDYMFIRYKVEAQDLANSGWDYTNSNSFITLSFWVKASVAQTYNFRLETADGTGQNFPFQYTLSADTWTKITKTISGNSNLTFDNNNGNGLELHWQIFRGTDFTDNSVSNDTWAAYASGTRTKDATSTWYTTNDATFELTGVQLEVGSVATDFEHRSFVQELALCQRYYQFIDYYSNTGSASNAFKFAENISYYQQMRAAPTMTSSSRGSNTGTASPSAWSNGGYINETHCSITVGSATHAFVGRAKLDAEL